LRLHIETQQLILTVEDFIVHKESSNSPKMKSFPAVSELYAQVSPTVCFQQCRSSPTLGPPQNAYRGPLVIHRSFHRYATSQGRVTFKPKYPNCRHNFGRTRSVARFQGLGGMIFVFIVCLKQVFLSTTKFGGNCP